MGPVLEKAVCSTEADDLRRGEAQPLTNQDACDKNDGDVMYKPITISNEFSPNERAVVFTGNCLDFLRTIREESFQLIITSPPYNLGKEYERRLDLNQYLEQQRAVIRECVRVLKPTFVVQRTQKGWNRVKSPDEKSSKFRVLNSRASCKTNAEHSQKSISG